jgi:hypothetical protein
MIVLAVWVLHVEVLLSAEVTGLVLGNATHYVTLNVHAVHPPYLALYLRTMELLGCGARVKSPADSQLLYPPVVAAGCFAGA